MREHHATTVLVVDAEPVIVRLAADILRRHGYDALTAGDGRQAVDTFRRHGTAIDAVVIEQRPAETVRSGRHRCVELDHCSTGSG